MKTALTDRAVKAMHAAVKAYDVHDAIVPGLSLNVLPSGLKRFVLLTRFPGAKHPTRRALGAYGALTLEAARVKARTPSGAAIRPRKRMHDNPHFLSRFVASMAEPPVASIGSSR